MADSVNFELEVKRLQEIVDELRECCQSLRDENEVLRKIAAEEISLRLSYRNENARLIQQNRDNAFMFDAIVSELNKAARKEELVKSLRAIIGNHIF